MTKILLAIALLSPLSLRAEGLGRLLELPARGIAKISHPGGEPWRSGDFLCLYREEKTIACGVVRATDARTATLALDFTNEALEVGDRVDRAKPAKKTPGAPIIENDNVRLNAGGGATFFFKTALLWDVSQWFSSTTADIAVSNHVSYGAKFDFFDVFRVNPKLTGKGALLTRTFFTLPHFSGISAQIGMGPYFFSGTDGTNTASSVSFVAELNVGFRFVLLRGLSIGFQSGLRYITAPQLVGVNIGKFHSFRGAIGIDLALRF